MFGRCFESRPAPQIDDDALFNCEALRLVHGESVASDQRELFTTHTGALFDAHFGQDRNPFRLVGVECWPTIFRHLDDQGLREDADRSASRIDNPDQIAARAIRKPILIRNVASDHHFASAN